MAAPNGREVVLFADTFNANFEREKIEAALRVLVAAGYRVHVPGGADGGGRPLCCGRTFLAAGLVEQARFEASRSLAALLPFARARRSDRRTRAELPADVPRRGDGDAAGRGRDEVAACAMLFEEFVAREMRRRAFPSLASPIAATALLHGHCHQKSFGAMGATEKVLRLIPGLEVRGDRVELLRHGRRLRLSGGNPRRYPRRWANSRFFPACARRPRTRWSSRTAFPAVIKFATA